MLDQVYDDVKLERKKALPIDLDKPGSRTKKNCIASQLYFAGLGQIYCVPCARYFRDDDNHDRHIKTKTHKKRVKELMEEPHRGEPVLMDNGGAGRERMDAE
jgi:hypothetical protein